MKPLAAQLRQQQRKARLQESLQKADTSMLSSTAPRSRRSIEDRIITQAEWEELVQTHEDSGKGFRRFLLVAVFVFCLILLYGKYDIEYQVEVPQKESGRGFPGDAHRSSQASSTGPEMDEYLKTLGVNERFVSLEPNLKEEEEKMRRLENFRVKKEVRKAYKSHLKNQSALVYCGRSCQQQQGAVQNAYNRLEAQVDRELFGVLLDVEDTKSARTTSMSQLKEKYEEKKAKIEATEENEELREMALEELRDAFEILQDPEARKYYLLFGEKPPESMRYVSARHGGWGQEIALGTFKFKIIWMWLDFLHNHLGLWGETIILGSLVLLVLAKLPQSLEQSMKILEELDIDGKEE